jgi:tRNA(Ile)-lysidine synthase
LLETFVKTIQKYHMVEPGDGVVIAVSGGPDSLAMLHAFKQIREEMALQMVVVHVNHMLRGEAALSDAAFVKSVCDDWKIPFEYCEADVSGKADREGLSIETAGRQVRYACFETVREKYGAQKIAVGQNKNDAVETFLMNLFRGAGLDGLSSTDYVREGIFIRPLLDISRFEIESYCEAQGLNPRKDHTNEESVYTRNKIRNELLPYIRENFNAGAEDTLARTLDLLRADRDFWRVHCEDLFKKYGERRDGGTFLRDAFSQELEFFEKYQLLRYAVRMERGHLDDLSQAFYKRIFDLNQTGTAVELDEKYRILKTYGGFLIERLKSDADQEEIPTLYTKVIPIEARNQYVFDDKTVGIDLESIVGQLFIRKRRPGDVFIPLGMQGHKKLKDFFIDRKTPLKERERTWLICDEEKIVWVYGMRIHEHCKMTNATKNIMIISLGVIVEKP